MKGLGANRRLAPEKEGGNSCALGCVVSMLAGKDAVVMVPWGSELSMHGWKGLPGPRESWR